MGKAFLKCKRSSLLGLFVGDEIKKFHNTDTRPTCWWGSFDATPGTGWTSKPSSVIPSLRSPCRRLPLPRRPRLPWRQTPSQSRRRWRRRRPSRPEVVFPRRESSWWRRKTRPRTLPPWWPVRHRRRPSWPGAADHIKLFFVVVTSAPVNYIECLFQATTLAHSQRLVQAGNAKGGSIIVPLTSCLTGLD